MIFIFFFNDCQCPFNLRKKAVDIFYSNYVDVKSLLILSNFWRRRDLGRSYYKIHMTWITIDMNIINIINKIELESCETK